MLSCMALAASAQVSVEQRIDSLQMIMGEQTVLRLSVTLPEGTEAVLPKFAPSDTLTGGVEVVSWKDRDTTQAGEGRVRIARDYVLTSFDEGLYRIPPLDVMSGGKAYHGNELALKVLPVEIDTLHPGMMYPPKDVQDNPFRWSEWSGAFWRSVLFILLLLVIGYLIARLRDNKPVIRHIRVVKRLLPHQKALGAINAIKENRPDTQEGQKEYYTRLTDALRQYIEERFGFSAREMTSGEILQRLQENGDETMMGELGELFRTADLVKFAKYETLMNENDRNLVHAVEFINQTKVEGQPVEERVETKLSDDDRKTRKRRRGLKAAIAVAVLAALGLLASVIYAVWMLMM